MTDNTQTLGKEAEEAAAAHLERKGYSIVERNLRNRLGEVDIVAKRDDLLVFVEVKAGSGDKDFPPSLHFDARKRRKLLNLARAYLMKHREPPATRFDLLALTKQGDQWAIEHFEDVLSDSRP